MSTPRWTDPSDVAEQAVRFRLSGTHSRAQEDVLLDAAALAVDLMDKIGVGPLAPTDDLVDHVKAHWRRLVALENGFVGGESAR